eukprot:scaffold40633_cov64-Phaeocystis_antarctica.AAC.2
MAPRGVKRTEATLVVRFLPPHAFRFTVTSREFSRFFSARFSPKRLPHTQGARRAAARNARLGVAARVQMATSSRATAGTLTD